MRYVINTLLCVHTPRNVRESSKHVLVLFDDGNCVKFPITFCVEGSGIPAVTGGTITQLPKWVWTNHRFYKSDEMTEEKFIALDDS